MAVAAGRLAAPTDYFCGRRRPAIEIPDNILFFRRASAHELKDGTLQPHFHHRWVLIAALAGRGSVVADGISYRMAPGALLLLPPLRLHRYERIAKGTICWLFITFELTARDARSAMPTPGRLTRESLPLLHDALRAWGSGDVGPAASARLASCLALVLLSLRAPSEQRAALPSDDHELVAKINAWLASHSATAARLQIIARDLGVSESHLRAIFRRRHGISVGRYVREARCRLAALELRAGRGSIADVAEACGFGSVYSFGRTFKRVLGVTPGAFSKGNSRR